MNTLKLLVALVLVGAAAAAQERPDGIRGAVDTSNPDERIAVRHDTPQAGDEVVTLRYFRIRKGTFDEFLSVSREGVWPFFEKIGCRVVGMWKLDNPQPTENGEEKDYDEVYLMARYASVEHWEASRDMAHLGGNGPDYVRCLEGLKRRQELTIETNVVFMRGETWQSPPMFMPAVEETANVE